LAALMVQRGSGLRWKRMVELRRASRDENPLPEAPREWLVANGLGGHASATVTGAITRRYHGDIIVSRSRGSIFSSQRAYRKIPAAVATSDLRSTKRQNSRPKKTQLIIKDV
jgi:hypothetical protein